MEESLLRYSLSRHYPLSVKRGAAFGLPIRVSAVRINGEVVRCFAAFSVATESGSE